MNSNEATWTDAEAEALAASLRSALRKWRPIVPDIRIVPMETYLFYPSNLTLVQPMTPASYVAKLKMAGVILRAQSEGVILARGPSDWFSERNRKDLRTRVSVLHPYLIGLRLQKEANP